MNYKYIAAILLSMVYYGVFAQSIANPVTIKGVLLTDSTKEGVPYATIKIAHKKAKEKGLKMFVSDLNGNFKEKITATGDFILTATSIGKEPLSKEFSVEAGQKMVDLGNLYVKDAANTLQEVEIKAQKPLVKADIDKIQYSVEDDPDSKTNSVIEMLRKVPLVTVDGEDKITVNGSSNFKIQINGKPNNMMTKSPTDVLKSMPASSIKYIEVITDPGVKEDAEGVGGILNIVTTQKSSMEGYTLSLTANGGTRGAGGSVYGMASKGKFTISARYNYNANFQPRMDMWSTRRSTGEITSKSYDTDSKGTSDGNYNFQWGNMEASYEIDTLRLITASFGLWGGRNKYKSESNVNAFVPGAHDGKQLYGYSQHTDNNNSWYSIDGSLDYQRLFSVKDRMLTFSYKINTNPETTDGYSIYDIDDNYDLNWHTFVESLKNQHTKGSENTMENTIQVDFATPIKKIHTIEVGTKYILRDSHSENDRYISNEKSEYVFDEVNSMHYKHLNNILGVYAGYSLKLKKFSGKAGMRYEYTSQDVKYKLGRGDDFINSFNDFLPAVSLGWKLTQFSNLKLAYNMRIQRPGIWYLNPYIDDSNPQSISQGNPNLNSEKNHSFNLSYNSFTQKFNISVSARYSFTDNGIQRIISMRNDNDIPGLPNPTGNDVIYSSYDNSGKNKYFNLQGYINWNATKDTRVYMNLDGGYRSLEGSNNQKNSGWSFWAYGGAQQSFAHDWRISLNLYGRSPRVSLQGSNNGFFSLSASVTKSFLDKRLSLSISGGDFLQGKYEFKNSSWGEGFKNESITSVSRAYVNFSVSYRIGELKASVKKVARSIQNDDVKGGESSDKTGSEGSN